MPKSYIIVFAEKAPTLTLKRIMGLGHMTRVFPETIILKTEHLPSKINDCINNSLNSPLKFFIGELKEEPSFNNRLGEKPIKENTVKTTNDNPQVEMKNISIDERLDTDILNTINDDINNMLNCVGL